jgi:acetoin utilization protein AcuB
MRIGDIMTTNVETIPPGELAGTAWSRMRQRNIHHLVVVDGKEIVGIISDRDLGGARADETQLAHQRVADLMHEHPVTTKPEATVREAANLLRGNVIDCAPVVDGDHLVGIITTTDVLDLVGRGAERPVDQAKRWTLKHRGPRQQKSRRPR